ncbi:MAG TPA: HDOD domain-containing protein [Fimbriimonadaceae bacterium]|nr:HDOD domain-containing protein [Fimbriimonadaceae bacterium]
MPRKVACLLQSDRYVDQALVRASGVVRSRGLRGSVIGRIVGTNQHFSSLVLSVVNVERRPGERHSNLDSAHAEIGDTGFWRAAVVASWIDVVVACTARASFSGAPMIATAWASAETAAWMTERHIVDADEAFVTALLAESGLAALTYALPDVYSALAANRTSRMIHEFEAESLGFDHGAVGEALLSLYGFPESIAEFARVHESNPLFMKMDQKLFRAALTAVAAVGGNMGFATATPDLDELTLEGALLKLSDKPEVLSYAADKLRVGLSLRAGPDARAA